MTAAPARAYAASSTYHGRSQRPRFDLGKPVERGCDTSEPVDDVSREILEPRDRVEVDGFRPDAERVAALVRQRAERQLHQRRRRRDLSGFQPERSSQRAEALLEIRRRVAGAMRDPGEPEQELDRRLVRRLELGTSRNRVGVRHATCQYPSQPRAASGITKVIPPRARIARVCAKYSARWRIPTREWTSTAVERRGAGPSARRARAEVQVPDGVHRARRRAAARLDRVVLRPGGPLHDRPRDGRPRARDVPRAAVVLGGRGRRHRARRRRRPARPGRRRRTPSRRRARRSRRSRASTASTPRSPTASSSSGTRRRTGSTASRRRTASSAPGRRASSTARRRSSSSCSPSARSSP